MPSPTPTPDEETTGVQALGEFISFVYLVLYFVPSFLLGPLRTLGLTLSVKNKEKVKFSKRYSDVKCIEDNHMWAKHEAVERQVFENHPHSDKDYAYAVTLHKCLGCERFFTKNGLTFRALVGRDSRFQQKETDWNAS